MAVDMLVPRIAHLEGAYEQIDKRLDSMEHRMDSIDYRLTSLDQKLDRYFLWMLGLLVVSILLPMASRFAGH
jgi:tetrahydromethanopterin S-methyltransferase subunit G